MGTDDQGGDVKTDKGDQIMEPGAKEADGKEAEGTEPKVKRAKAKAKEPLKSENAAKRQLFENNRVVQRMAVRPRDRRGHEGC